MVLKKQNIIFESPHYGKIAGVKKLTWIEMWLIISLNVLFLLTFKLKY